MNSENEEKLVAPKISEEILAICALDSAKNVDGFFGFVRKGIKISQHEDGMIVDLYIMVEHGHKIPEVAWNLQNQVKKDIESSFDLNIKSINIHVQGVHFIEED
jgi:uncharacterized alkaline shock family protein YloU